jgi:LemA protein
MYIYYIIGAIVLILLWLVMTYNGLIQKKNQVQEGWSDIDVQLKRRYDLIPNLVEAVKGYMGHEEGVLTKVTEARNMAMKADSASAKSEAENALSGTLKSLFAVAEQYPDLKASANFAQLQDELSDTENKIQAARRFYNGQVRDFNTAIQVFPTSLFASMFQMKSFDFFELANETERENVKVQF